jgi:hypothetical protein
MSLLAGVGSNFVPIVLVTGVNPRPWGAIVAQLLDLQVDYLVTLFNFFP